MRKSPPPSPRPNTAPATPGSLQSVFKNAADNLRKVMAAPADEDDDDDEDAKFGGAVTVAAPSVTTESRSAGGRSQRFIQQQPLDPMALRTTFIRPNLFLNDRRSGGGSGRSARRGGTFLPPPTMPPAVVVPHKCPAKGGCGCGGPSVWKDDE